MKRRLIICSSLITIILSCFSFPIFAEETVQDSSNLHTLSDGIFLDQYFYDNFDPLPYLSGRYAAYIDLDYKPNNNTLIECNFKINYLNVTASQYLFGTIYNGKRFSVRSTKSGIDPILSFDLEQYTWSYKLEPYSIYNLKFSKDVYINNNLIYSFTDSDFEIDYNLYLLALHSQDTGINSGGYDIYNFKIYEYNDNTDSYDIIRYYYPAKSKSSGTIGLYDAKNKTFIGSSSNVVFINPSNEYVENFQISSFLTNSLTWIGQIFDAIIQMPIIIVFMAIGLAGVMFRWGRRIVHF